MTYAAVDRAVAQRPGVAGETRTHPPTPEVDMARLIITIDGPAGTGKSTVARLLARRLGLEFLDTGAMYRAATALALDRGIDVHNDHAVADLVSEADLRFDWSADPPALHVFGDPITTRLRDPDVTENVSAVSELPGVRSVLVENQRRIGQRHPRLVTEGRDQGSVVFKDACVKFYLDAGARIRAQRRAQQLRQIGREADVDTIEVEIRERDRRDSTRAVGPLVCPEDAVVVDTSHLRQDQVVDELERLVRHHAPAAELPPLYRSGA